MADVYVLASPAPTLYVYPSALHPEPPEPPEPPAPEQDGLFGVAYPVVLTKEPINRRKRDEEALLAFSLI